MNQTHQPWDWTNSFPCEIAACICCYCDYIRPDKNATRILQFLKNSSWHLWRRPWIILNYSTLSACDSHNWKAQLNLNSNKCGFVAVHNVAGLNCLQESQFIYYWLQQDTSYRVQNFILCITLAIVGYISRMIFLLTHPSWLGWMMTCTKRPSSVVPFELTKLFFRTCPKAKKEFINVMQFRGIILIRGLIGHSNQVAPCTYPSIYLSNFQ